MANVEVPGSQQDWSRLTKLQVATKILQDNPHLTREEVLQQAACRGHTMSFSTIDTVRARLRGKPYKNDNQGRKLFGSQPQPKPQPQGTIKSIQDLIRTVKTLKATIEELGGLEQARELIELF